MKPAASPAAASAARARSAVNQPSASSRTSGASSRPPGHVQVADHPGRAEPGTGSLPIDATLAALRRTGYRGYVSCEYKPSGATIDSLGWLAGRLTQP